MFVPSIKIIQLLRTFAPTLTKPVFSKAATLFCGVVLSPGRRTAAGALRAVGLQDDQTFGKRYRFLARDRWSAITTSKRLLAVNPFGDGGNTQYYTEPTTGLTIAWNRWYDLVVG
jgi:hypothetical protein